MRPETICGTFEYTEMTNLWMTCIKIRSNIETRYQTRYFIEIAYF